MTIMIDTHAAIQEIEAAGADSKLAEAIVKTVSQPGDQPATKSDLAALRADLRAGLAQLEQRTPLRIATIVAIANGNLFGVLRYVPPATRAALLHDQL
jgi:hypothetical protein